MYLLFTFIAGVLSAFMAISDSPYFFISIFSNLHVKFWYRKAGDGDFTAYKIARVLLIVTVFGIFVTFPKDGWVYPVVAIASIFSLTYILFRYKIFA